MKNKIVTVTFLVILLGLFIANVATPAKELSFGERRRLAQFPNPTAKTVFNAEFMTGFDKYSTDQFAAREQFRGVKTALDRNVFLKRDTNGLFRVGDGVHTIEYPLREDKVAQMCLRMNTLFDRYLADMNVYYSIVPDKNYYLPDDGRYLLMDYDKLVTQMRQGMPQSAIYIDLFGSVEPGNYYNSDGHWRQETLKPIVETLYAAMENDTRFDPATYEPQSYSPFYGAYYGQLAGQSPADTITWLENDVTRDAVVTSVSHPDRDDLTVYNTDGLGGMDSYDVYLYGAQPLISMENTHNPDGKELIIFRDSFGSSLAPVMLEGYSKITLVDLRYITQELLASFLEFEDQDVLLLYSTTIINNSDIIR